MVLHSDKVARVDTQQYQMVLDDLPSAVALVAKSGVVEWCNQNWQRLASAESDIPFHTYGMGHNLLTQWFKSTHTPGQHGKNIYEGLQRILNGAEVQFCEDVHYKSNGKNSMIRVVISSTQDGHGLVSLNCIDPQAIKYQNPEQWMDLQNLVESYFDIVFIYRIAPDAGVEYISPIAEQLSGYPIERFYREKEFLQDIVHPEDRQLLNALMTGLDVADHPVILRWVWADGQIGWTEIRMKLLIDEQEHPFAVQGIVRDITERTYSDEAYHRLVDQSLMGMAIMQDGRIIFLNPKTEEMFGYSRADILAFSAQQVFDVIHPDDRGRVMKVYQDRMAGEVVPEKLRFRSVKKDGSICWLEATSSAVTYLSKPVVLVSYLDITTQIEAEEKLSKSEGNYHRIFKNVPIGIFNSTPEGKFLDVNPHLARMLKYDSPEELIRVVNRQSIADVLYVKPEMREQFLNDVILEGGWIKRENRYRCKDGSIMDANLTVQVAATLPDSEPDLAGFVEDVTQEKQKEHALVESERRFREMLDTVDLLAVALDDDANVTYINDYLLTLTGYRRDEVVGNNWFRKFTPDNQVITSVFHNTVKAGIFPVHYENDIVTRDCSRRLIQWTNNTTHDSQGNIIGTTSIGQDITARKQAETQVLASLHEKEVLLKEIHHRVKNNLMLVSSLLDLQMEKLEDPGITRLLAESQQRIRAIARLHEALYRSKDLRSIHMREYFEDLINHLFMTYGNRVDGVSLKVNIEDISLDIDTAIPSGLILNELISNALKHAFPPEFLMQKQSVKDTYTPEIEVEFHQINGSFRLIIRDNGIGIDKKLKITESETLGLQLVGLFTQQLDGKVRLENEGKTNIVIEFPDSQSGNQGGDQ
jgi:PAS domain S-box-containing protein